MDIKKMQAAIEADARQAIDGLGQSLVEAKAIIKGNASGARVTNQDQLAVLAARKRLGLSQADFAKAINTPLRTLQEWEQGRANPPGAALKLCEVLVNNPSLVA